MPPPMTPSVVHGAILSAKAVRSVTAWLSAYLAAKLLQDKYTQEVYVERVIPSPLTTYVWYYTAFQCALAVLSLVTMAGVAYVTSGKASELMVLVKFAVADAVLELVTALAVLLSVANVMQNKKYFNYRYEGLRAIRALRTMAYRVTLVTSFLPYYKLMGDIQWALIEA